MENWTSRSEAALQQITDIQYLHVPGKEFNEMESRWMDRLLAILGISLGVSVTAEQKFIALGNILESLVTND